MIFIYIHANNLHKKVLSKSLLNEINIVNALNLIKRIYNKKRIHLTTVFTMYNLRLLALMVQRFFFL